MAIRKKLLYSKTDLANLLGVRQRELGQFLPENLRLEVRWDKGKRLFREQEAFIIIKYFKGLKSDEEIKQMIYSLSA